MHYSHNNLRIKKQKRMGGIVLRLNGAYYFFKFELFFKSEIFFIRFHRQKMIIIF
jgi:hypothetical protein